MSTRFPEVHPVVPADFAGHYSWYDDGWSGTMMLTHEDGPALRGLYHSYRFDADYPVTATVDEPGSNRIELSIADFNGLDRQVFEGYLFTDHSRAMSGRTSWKTEPYGFFARRSALRVLSPFHDEAPARPAQYLGSYSLFYDGGQGTVHLRDADGQTVHGGWSPLGQVPELPVVAETASAVPNEVTLRLGGDPEATLTGWLFSRPKNAIAGWLDHAGTRRGCYLVRYR